MQLFELRRPKPPAAEACYSQPSTGFDPHFATIIDSILAAHKLNRVAEQPARPPRGGGGAARIFATKESAANLLRTFAATSCGPKGRAGRSLAQRGPLFACPAGFSPHLRNIRAGANIRGKYLLRQDAVPLEPREPQPRGGGGSLCSPPQAATRNNYTQNPSQKTALFKEASRAEVFAGKGPLFAVSAGLDPQHNNRNNSPQPHY